MKFRKKCDFLVSQLAWLLSIWAIVCVQPSLGKYCETKTSFNLPAVTPMWEEEISVVGCLSKNTSSRGQEVHVLHLKAVDGWPESKVVTVHIRPSGDGRSFYKKPFILLLHSEFTVSWKLIGERLNNNTYHRIIVTGGSQVIDNRALQVTIQRRATVEIKHLLTWLNKRYKSVTSYAKMSGANNIYLNLSSVKNESAPAKCDINSRKSVTHVSAVAQDSIPISQRKGCIARGAVGSSNRIVHIIKIHDSTRDDSMAHETTGSRKVIIHINSRSQHYPAKDVALVLQAVQPVEWILVNDGTKGRLDIVTEGQVITPRNVLSQELSVRTESLPNSTKELMAYSEDWLGPSFTFTEVQRANSVRVLVDGSDEEGPPPTEFDYSHPGNEQAGHRPRAIGNKDMLKSRLRHGHTTREGSETHMLVKSKRPLKANDIIRMPSVMLMEVMTVECLPQHMKVSFPRISMEQLGLQSQDISLAESHCSVTVNETHYVLSSPFHSCGTKRESDDEKIVYKNAVHFHFHVQKLGSFSNNWKEMESSTLPVDDEDSGGSGNSALPTVDSAEANTLEFQCEYIHVGPPSQIELPETPPATRDTTTLTAARGLFSMEMSRDSDFIHPLAKNEYPFISYENDMLYVETRLDDGSALQVVTENCWLSEINDPKAAPVSKLINNGCPTGSSVKFESSGRVSSNRFSFRLGIEYLIHPVLFLHCKLGICSSDKSQTTKWGLKQCVDPNDFCKIDSGSLRSYLEIPRGTHHNIFSRGPIQIKKRLSTNTRNPFSNVPFRQQGKLDLEVLGGETIDVRCTLPDNPSVIVIGLSTESVIGIAFSSFIIGVGLSAVLWCIYLKTDPLRGIHRHPTHHHSGYDLSGHSGSSTPSSQSPMTA